MREQGTAAVPSLQGAADPRVTELRRVDTENRAWLKQIVEKSGWPTAGQVGKDGAHAAWLLVQHADDEPAFQKRCLELMTKAPAGEVSPTDVAYLTDRVLIKETGKQLYGTQVNFAKGKAEPLPLQNRNASINCARKWDFRHLPSTWSWSSRCMAASPPRTRKARRKTLPSDSAAPATAPVSCPGTATVRQD